MENFDKMTGMLDDLIMVNNDKLRTLYGKHNSLSCEISHVILEQMGYIKHIQSNKKYKDGLNLTFMKKLFCFFKEFSFISFVCLLILFLFNFNIFLAISTLLMAYISYFCKYKYIDYAGMISIYETAIKEYSLDECIVDLNLIKRKKREVQGKINDLKNKRELINEEIEVIKEIIDKVTEDKHQLINNNYNKSDIVKVKEFLSENEQKGSILVKKLGIR